MHIRPSGEESLKHLTGGLGVVVVVVHGPKVVVERLDFGSRQLELIDPHTGQLNLDPQEQLALLEELEETARLWLLGGRQATPLTDTQINDLRAQFNARW